VQSSVFSGQVVSFNQKNLYPGHYTSIAIFSEAVQDLAHEPGVGALESTFSNFQPLR
jgi:hypothetical protein